MPYDSISPPVRVYDIGTRKGELEHARELESVRQPPPGAHPWSLPTALHPLALHGWPLPVPPVEHARRRPRRRRIPFCRKGER